MLILTDAIHVLRGSERVFMLMVCSFFFFLQSDGNTAFLRAARAGHLDKVLEHLKSNIDINTSNSVSTLQGRAFVLSPCVHGEANGTYG